MIPYTDDGRETKVGEAGAATLIDEDICLVVVMSARALDRR